MQMNCPSLIHSLAAPAYTQPPSTPSPETGRGSVTSMSMSPESLRQEGQRILAQIGLPILVRMPASLTGRHLLAAFLIATQLYLTVGFHMIPKSWHYNPEAGAWHPPAVRNTGRRNKIRLRVYDTIKGIRNKQIRTTETK